MKDKVIIFDFDGVIVNSLQVTYELSKKALPFLSFRMFTYTYRSRLVLYILLFIKRIISSKKARSEYKKTYSQDKLERSELYEGMKELLELLSHDYVLSLNTNSYDEDCLPILDKHDIGKFLAITKTSSQSKSKQEKTEQILNESGITKENSVFITDTIADVEGAEISGVKAIAVTWGIHNRKDFEHSSVRDSIVAIVDTPLELRKAINEYLS